MKYGLAPEEKSFECMSADILTYERGSGKRMEKVANRELYNFYCLSDVIRAISQGG